MTADPFDLALLVVDLAGEEDRVEAELARALLGERTRALAAEQRAEAAEAREARLRAVVASLADQWQREADSETSCRLGTGRRAGLLSCRRDLRAAALAPAAESGREDDRG